MVQLKVVLAAVLDLIVVTSSPSWLWYILSVILPTIRLSLSVYVCVCVCVFYENYKCVMDVCVCVCVCVYIYTSMYPYTKHNRTAYLSITCF